jgi:hypothetical protein
MTEQPDTENERVEEEPDDMEIMSTEDSDADMTTSVREGQEPPLEQRWEIHFQDVPGFAHFLKTLETGPIKPR